MNYKWAIFNSYVKLPEGNGDLIYDLVGFNGTFHGN
jgi:hypothetical protein